MEIGSQVTWMHVSSRGSTFSMRTKTGQIEKINGDVATVITGRNKRRVEVPVIELRLAGQRTKLTEFAETVFGANSARQEENEIPQPPQS